MMIVLVSLVLFLPPSCNGLRCAVSVVQNSTYNRSVESKYKALCHTKHYKGDRCQMLLIRVPGRHYNSFDQRWSCVLENERIPYEAMCRANQCGRIGPDTWRCCCGEQGTKGECNIHMYALWEKLRNLYLEERNHPWTGATTTSKSRSDSSKSGLHCLSGGEADIHCQKCFIGQKSGEVTQGCAPVSPCSVGCVHEANETRCCCAEDKCNTFCLLDTGFADVGCVESARQGGSSSVWPFCLVMGVILFLIIAIIVLLLVRAQIRKRRELKQMKVAKKSLMRALFTNPPHKRPKPYEQSRTARTTGQPTATTNSSWSRTKPKPATTQSTEQEKGTKSATYIFPISTTASK